MLLCTYFILVQSMPGKVEEKFLFLILATVFDWTHLAILFVAYMCS